MVRLLFNICIIFSYIMIIPLINYYIMWDFCWFVICDGNESSICCYTRYMIMCNDWGNAIAVYGNGVSCAIFIIMWNDWWIFGYVNWNCRGFINENNVCFICVFIDCAVFNFYYGRIGGLILEIMMLIFDEKGVDGYGFLG